MTLSKSGVGLVLGLFAGLCAVVFGSMPHKSRRQGFFEMLQGGGIARVSLERARFHVSGTVTSRLLGKDETNALLMILRDVTPFPPQPGMVCVVLLPMNDSLALTVDEAGRKVYYNLDVSNNCSLLGDQSTGRAYVVPEQHTAELAKLLRGAEPRKPLIANRPTEDVLQQLLSTMQWDEAESGKPARTNGSNGKSGR